MCRKVLSFSIAIVALWLFLSAVVFSHEGETHEVATQAPDFQTAIQWLESRQFAAGEVVSPGEPAGPAQATSHATSVLIEQGADNFDRNAALASLRAENDRLSTEYLADLIRVLLALDMSAEAETQALLARRSDDGGFASFAGYESTALDTALALLALQKTGDDTAYAGAAINFLISEQRSDGAFELYAGQPSLEVTTLVLRALKPYIYRYAIGDMLRSAIAVLYQTKLGDHWGQDWQTALALQALVPVTTDVSRYQAAANGLAERQSPQGHWDNSVHTTALAIRAFKLLESIEVPVDPEKGVISGALLDTTSGSAIDGATVEILNGTAPSISLNDDGRFLISGLDPGSYLVGYSAPGYLSVSQNIRVQKGQFVKVGAIHLSVAPSTALLEGKIIDGVNGQPLAGAVVEVATGSMRSSATTDGNGQYQLLSEPGAATITASANGYRSTSVSAELPAGQVLNFSSSLLPSTEPAITASSLHGRVVDKTGKPLESAEIHIHQGDVIESVASDVDGYFEFSNLPAGTKFVQVQKSGFETVAANLLIAEKSRVDLGDIQLAERAEMVETSVNGRITDSVTGQSIAGAKIAIGGQSVTTDNNGLYRIDGIEVLEFSVSVSAPGYLYTDKLVALSEHSDITLDIPIRSATLGGVSIASVVTDRSSYDAYDPVYITAVLENTAELVQRARLLVRVISPNGNEVESFTASYLPPLDPNSSPDEIAHYQQHLEDTIETIQPGERREIVLEQWWNTLRSMPGRYQVVVQAFDGATDNLVAERSVAVNVQETRRLRSLTTRAKPGYAIIQRDTDVELTVDIHNASNTDVDFSFTFTLRHPDGREAVSGSQSVSLLVGQVNREVLLQTFSHSFDASGDYVLEITDLNGVVTEEQILGLIFVPPAIRLEVHQGLNPTEVVPLEGISVDSRIEIKGVDGE